MSIKAFLSVCSNTAAVCNVRGQGPVTLQMAAHTSTAQSSNLHGSRICVKLYNDGNVTEHILLKRDEGST